MKHKTFLEVMAGSDMMRMSQSQKRVLRKVLDTGDDPVMAATQVVQAEDSRNLIAAAKTLAKYGYITTEPYILSYDDEPKSIKLTDKGQEAAEKYDVQNDQTLVTPEEQQAGAPQGEQPATEPGEAGAAEPGAGEEAAGGEEELGGEELEGEGVGLELSSFFHQVNDLAKLKS